VARKPKHFVPETVAAVDASFESVIARVGGRFDSDREARLRAIPVDGTPIGDGFAALRGPATSYYAQGYLETRSVARLMLELDLDHFVTDVRGSDKPDVTVIFSDRPTVYVEQTNVSEYDGTPFDRHLEEINHALDDLRKADETFRGVWERGMLTVRLTDPGVALRPDRTRIAKEIATFAIRLDGDTSLRCRALAEFPALNTYNAFVVYRTGQRPNPTICNVDGGFVDPQPAWVATRLQAALAEKRERAVGYDPNAKPLWLLLNLVGPHLLPRFVPPLVHSALVDERLTPFDRVLVMYPGISPVDFIVEKP
jgi:hypothetical protein